MAAPIVERSTGDVIPANDHNDVKDYIEDGTYRVNTLSLSIGGTEIINSAGGVVLLVAPADHTYSGTVASLTAGEAITSGQICYLKADGKMWLAKADAEITSGSSLVTLATAAMDAEATGVFLLKGFFQDASVYAITPCKPQFISAATGGAITETIPAVATNIARIVGYSKTADIIYFDPDRTYIEI